MNNVKNNKHIEIEAIASELQVFGSEHISKVLEYGDFDFANNKIGIIHEPANTDSSFYVMNAKMECLVFRFQHKDNTHLSESNFTFIKQLHKHKVINKATNFKVYNVYRERECFRGIKKSIEIILQSDHGIPDRSVVFKSTVQDELRKPITCNCNAFILEAFDHKN